MKNKSHIKNFRNCLLIALLSLLILDCGREATEESEGVLVPDHIGKARAFYHQGDYAGAVEMYHKALEFDPDNPDTYLQLGIVYDDNLKDEQQAVYFYKQFLTREPDSDKAKRVRSWIVKSHEMIEKGAGESEVGLSREDIRSMPPVLKPTPGQRIPTEVIPSAPERKENPPATEVVKPVLYTVGQGDTLAGIAEKFYGDRTAWRRIYQANRDKLPNPNALNVGQELSILPDRERAVIAMPGE